MFLYIMNIEMYFLSKKIISFPNKSTNFILIIKNFFIYFYYLNIIVKFVTINILFII